MLLPVLDDAKHYWIAPDEVDKLIRAGESWLAAHPEKNLITRRYLGRRWALARAAFARLAELGDDVEEDLEPPIEEELTASSEEFPEPLLTETVVPPAEEALAGLLRSPAPEPPPPRPGTVPSSPGAEMVRPCPGRSGR
nr:hypothetical protein GCM10020093_041420 [Planobispora longispora]